MQHPPCPTEMGLFLVKRCTGQEVKTPTVTGGVCVCFAAYSEVLHCACQGLTHAAVPVDATSPPEWED